MDAMMRVMLAAAGGGGGGGGGGGCGFVLPTVWDDNFDCGSSLDTSGARFSGAKAWTLTNPSSQTWAYSGSNLVVTCQNLSDNVGRSSMGTLPSTDWTFLTKASGTGTGNFAGLYIYIRESSTQKALHFGVGDDFGYKHQVRRFNGSGSWYANYNGTSATAGVAEYLEIARIGSNLRFRSSLDGSSWTTLTTVAITTDFTTEPDQVGLSVWESASAIIPQVATFDFFQRTA